MVKIIGTGGQDDEIRWSACVGLYINRGKTKTPCKIPLLPIPERIISKYNNHQLCLLKGKLLPVISNQECNSYLKEIAQMCGITKRVTMHMGRRTFATIAIENDVPAETIVKIIGHRNFKHLHLYAKTSDRKILEDIQPLKNKFKEAFNDLESLPFVMNQ